jgi:peptidoglycan hydrolase-like protein with peptidoglycan-binding domain
VTAERGPELPAPSHLPEGRGRRGRGVAAGVVVVGLVCAAVAVAVTRSDGDAGHDGVQAELSTVTVGQQDLVLYDETTATLGFTESETVASPVDGTVTGVVDTGATIDAGTVVATVDGEPVVALIGDVPGWRDLDEDSSDGVDVRQLETNLVALGYDPDGAIEVDETFDDATTAAVERWEVSLGIDDDGEVAERQVVFVQGSLLVDTVSVESGGAARAGSALVEGRLVERRFLVPAAVGAGTVVDHLSAVGTPVATGTVLFWQGGFPVVAVEGDVAADPALQRELSVGVDDGADVEQLEAFLTAAGYDPDGAIAVDDEFDDATANAVVAWWRALGVVPADAVVDPGDVILPAGTVVTVPADLTVGAVVATDGSTAPGDTVALWLTEPTRLVTTTAAIGDDTYALGATVDLEFPDGTAGTGTVIAVGDVASISADDPDAGPTVSVSIEIDGAIPEAVASFVEIPVTIRVPGESALGALVVPVSALVALAEGGYAVEVVTGTAADGTRFSQYVAVDPGLYADGFVAVTSDALDAGAEVVVPS